MQNYHECNFQQIEKLLLGPYLLCASAQLGSQAQARELIPEEARLLSTSNTV